MYTHVLFLVSIIFSFENRCSITPSLRIVIIHHIHNLWMSNIHDQKTRLLMPIVGCEYRGRKWSRGGGGWIDLLKTNPFFKKLSESFQNMRAKGLMRKCENYTIQNLITLILNRFTNTKYEYDETRCIQLIRLYNPQGVFI